MLRSSSMERIEELEAKCHVLWLLNGGQTEEWNGDRCDCEYIQGNWNCKANIERERLSRVLGNKGE